MPREFVRYYRLSLVFFDSDDIISMKKKFWSVYIYNIYWDFYSIF